MARPDNVVLDWHPREEPDPRDAPFMLAAQTGIDTSKPVRPRQWTRGQVLDQGAFDCPICNQHGACTGYSVMHAVGATPRVRSVSDFAAHAYYHRAKELDEWAGQDYEGSSVHGAMAALKGDGLLTAYWWLDGVEALAHAVSRYGPVVVGTWWREGMFDVDEWGYVPLTGPIAGGHAYVIGGVDPNCDSFRIDNSWGADWGSGGSAKITWANMGALLAGSGAEATLPRKTRL